MSTPEVLMNRMSWTDYQTRVQGDGATVFLPCGATEQHGPHLPLDVDLVCPLGVAHGAGRAIPEHLLVLPVVAYGYTGHVMDFPGTINQHHTHFIDHVLDITKSLAYHGFKKIILLNGHGSNMPPLDLASRRTCLETDAECCAVSWWSLLTIDKEFLPRWRQSEFPGGCGHACELETSMYLHLDGGNVRTDLVADGGYPVNEERSDFAWIDLFGAGPATPVAWSSGFNATGVFGAATLATAAKGKAACDEAVRQLVRFVGWWRDRPPNPRRDLHRTPPTMPMPWGQTPSGPAT